MRIGAEALEVYERAYDYLIDVGGDCMFPGASDHDIRTLVDDNYPGGWVAFVSEEGTT